MYDTCDTWFVARKHHQKVSMKTLQSSSTRNGDNDELVSVFFYFVSDKGPN